MSRNLGRSCSCLSLKVGHLHSTCSLCALQHHTSSEMVFESAGLLIRSPKYAVIVFNFLLRKFCSISTCPPSPAKDATCQEKHIQKSCTRTGPPSLLFGMVSLNSSGWSTPYVDQVVFKHICCLCPLRLNVPTTKLSTDMTFKTAPSLIYTISERKTM